MSDLARPSSLPSPTPRLPVWSPDPAVPIVARVLAYLFALLTLLTVLRSCNIGQPPDKVAYPDRWRTYTGISGIAIPYPDNWEASQDSDADGSSGVFYLPPGDDVRVVVLTQRLPVFPDATVASRMNAEFEAYLQQKLPHYRAQGQRIVVGGQEWHDFTAEMPTGNVRAVTGAWVVTGHANRVVYLVATAPSTSWSDMERVFTYMTTHLAVSTVQ